MLVKEAAVDYGEMVRPSQQDVAPYEKGQARSVLDRRGLTRWFHPKQQELNPFQDLDFSRSGRNRR